ncbi:ABC transporter substrate-binding protein [Achromobacter xylosoxidans]|uniref:ABC transporter substrate-binding protein n=1 Tax=Alcaligenes xylosoxydans xylosoxydans TaxID=85698 RepID=UPI0006C14600|nr:ABC transporter substrate-binding protein [Achromobacter xylosoxidans]AMH07134.2 nitrate ABC transporter substrate-binding protein [Achromobacter xylosoxidans]AXA77893.1 nitrate ABC transporter substrate-binding protein [Achromobacter xylosoxidans]MCH4572811.1 ABC transporter substrate-binding protein [Achromobacter xylosoxidans]MCH4581592.1 ABC transporter substrate-binding protein [Achromobacter xylosoxidans]MDD7989065.1 ABC transporter substrate-binding protein [Achromobacter xylosoxidan
MKSLMILSKRIAALGLAALAAWGGSARAADVIRVGVATAGGGDPITWGGSPGGVVRVNQWLEQAFAADGVKVEWLFFKGAGPAVNEALSNKQIDFAYQGDLPQVVGRANGLKTKLLLVSGARNNLYLVAPPNSPLKSIEDLKDRKVSIFRGTNGHLVAINVLAAHGLAERDIKGVNLDAGSAQAALVSNGVDAAFGGYEWFKVRDQGLAKVIYSTQGQDPAYTRQASLLVREDFERENPAQVQKVVDVFVRAAQWSSDEKNRDALFKIWEKSGVPYASWQAEFDKQDLAARNSPLIDDFIIARYKAVVADAAKLKLIRREVSLDGWFDPRYLQNALKAQGLERYWTAFDAAGKPVSGPAQAAAR